MNFTDSDLTRLQRAMRTVLSPFEHPSLDQWRAAVCETTSDLLGAEKATFLLLGTPAVPIYETNLEPGAVEAYLSYYHRLVPRPRQRAQASVGIEERIVEDLPEYPRSEYYNEFVVPYRMHGVMTCVLLRDALEYGALSFHQGYSTGRRFGDRELALLNLLLPAFRAGTDSLLHLHAARADLNALLDTLPEGVLLFDASGTLLHANPAWARLLERDPDGERLRAEAAQIAATIRGLQSMGKVNVAALSPPTSQVTTASASYRLHGSYASALLPGSDGLLLVAVERLTPEFPSVEEVRQRFGVTKQQATVAVRIARGKAPAEIAKELFISLHTARRHTEAVLQKLGVHSRAEAAVRILSR